MTTGAEAVDLRELRTLAESGRYREVLARLERLPLPDVEKRTPLSLLAAEAHGRLGELSDAARWATLALETSRQRGEPQAELRARNYQGLIALRQGDIDAAERHLTAALEMARAQSDALFEARCLNNLGVIANLRGDRTQALADYQLALAAYQQAGLVRGMAETHHNIGITFRDLGDHQRALAAAEHAVRLARMVKDDTLIGLTLFGRAAIHLQQTDSSLAGVELERAAEAYRRVEFESGLAEVWRLQASVLRLKGNLAGALDLLRRAADLARERGSADTVADIDRDLGSALAVTGDTAGAREAWARAAAGYRRLGAVKAAEDVDALVTKPAPPGPPR